MSVVIAEPTKNDISTNKNETSIPTTKPQVSADTKKPRKKPTRRKAKVAFIQLIDSVIIDAVASFRANNDSELEFILSGGDEMSGGVPANVFEGILDALTKSAKFNLIGPTSLVDCFYPGSLRIRHRVGQEPEMIIKTPITKVDCICPQRQGIGMRLTLKNEKPVKQAPPIKSPLYVRVQKQWQFNMPAMPLVSYILKKTSGGKNKDEACKTEPRFEVEIELQRHKSSMDRTDDEGIAKILIEKTLDLCGRVNSVTGKRENIGLVLSRVHGDNGLFGHVQKPRPTKRKRNNSRENARKAKQVCKVDKEVKVKEEAAEAQEAEEKQKEVGQAQ
jgi:hypothetical protein